MNNVKLTKKTIDRIIAKSSCVAEFTVTMYKYVFLPVAWENIEKINGYPHIHCKTNEYIFTAIKLYNEHSLLNTWFNNGFSTMNSTAKEWEVIPCDYTLK